MGESREGNGLGDGHNDPEKGLLDTSDKHNHHHSKSKDKREMRLQLIKLGIMIVLTFIFFLVELVYGYMSNSMALIADSFHMLSDVLALAVALACILIANRRSKSNTFGWVRAEILGALVNGVFLLALCFSIFLESIERLLDPQALKEPMNVLIVGIIGLIVNVIGMFLFHSHSHHHASDTTDQQQAGGIEETSYLATSHQDGAMALADLKVSEKSLNGSVNRPKDSAKISDQPKSPTKTKSSSQMNMKGVYLHIVTDFIGSLIVIITASISIWLPGFETLKLYMDPALSMIMVVLIMFSTIPLVHETALILLQTTPSDVNLKEIEDKLIRTPGIMALHEFHVWRLVGERIIATVHIRFTSVEHYLKSAERIRDIFHEHRVHSVTVQPEFDEMSDREKTELECVLKCEPEDCQVATCCYVQNGLVVKKTSDIST